MRTSNPIFNEKTFNRYAYLTGTDPQDLMTVKGTATKSFVLLLLALCTATVSWLTVQANPSLVMPVVIGSAVGGLILGLVGAFAHRSAPIVGPLYALVEGVFLGAISMIFEAKYPGIAIQAVMMTFGVFLGMLLAFRSRVIRATSTFKKVVIGATLGIAVVYGISFVMFLFGARMPVINDPTPLGVAINLFTATVAALNLVLDFDLIERGSNEGAPKYMEWYAAFGLMVTLFWLYIEMLRLLSKLRR